MTVPNSAVRVGSDKITAMPLPLLCCESDRGVERSIYAGRIMFLVEFVCGLFSLRFFGRIFGWFSLCIVDCPMGLFHANVESILRSFGFRF